MIFYVLLTYGNRPAGSIHTHPAAKAQLALIKRLVSPHPAIKVSVKFDYCRRICGLRSLPTLERLLTQMKNTDGVKVRVDDVSRLFRITKMSDREQFLADLNKFGSKLFSLKHKKSLAEFSEVEARDLILHAEKSKLPAKQKRVGETESARASSLASRKSRSNSLAQQIQEIKDELLGSKGRATLQMVADEANAKGVRTTRGGRWTAQNVGRMLKSLE